MGWVAQEKCTGFQPAQLCITELYAASGLAKRVQAPFVNVPIPGHGPTLRVSQTDQGR
jgi:hypothetical protein